MNPVLQVNQRITSLPAVLVFLALTSCADHPGGPVTVPDAPALFAQAINYPGDDSLQIQTCIDNAANEVTKTCYLPQGDWEVNGPVELRSGVRIYGDGELTKIKFNNATWQSGIFVGEGVTGVTVERVKFIGNGHLHQFGVLVFGSQDITVQDSHSQYIGLVGATSRDDISRAEGDLSRNITVLRNNAVGPCGQNVNGQRIVCQEGTGPNVMLEAIWLKHTRTALIERNTISNFNFGIQWWGGDAGATPRPARVASDFNIRYNSVDQVIVGIWGALGENMRVEYNKATNCVDICLDDEGGRNNVFAYDTARFARYAMGVYHGAEGTIFENNVVEQNGQQLNQNGDPIAAHNILFRLQNGFYWPNTDVRVGRNRFIWSGANGYGQVEKEFSDIFVFWDNQLENVVLDLAKTAEEFGHGGVDVSGNVFTFNRPLPQNKPVIRVGHNYKQWVEGDRVAYGYHLYVYNNRLSTSATQVNVPGISSTQACGNCVVEVLINSNQVSGFSPSINAYTTSGYHNYRVTDNGTSDTIIVTAPIKTVTGNYAIP